MTTAEQIPRTTLTENAIRHEVIIPGFFKEGPAAYDERLFEGKFPINPVDSLMYVIKTDRGLYTLAAVRSRMEKRQPRRVSAVTARKTHAEAKERILNHQAERLPILGENHSDTSKEGFHIDGFTVTEPILVTDYMSGSHMSADLEPAFLRLIDKLRPDQGDSSEIDERIVAKSSYWLGPTVLGVSSVYDDQFEINAMENIVGTLDFSDKSPEDFLRILPDANEHYEYFDLAPLGSFDIGVRTGTGGYIITSAEGNTYAYECVGGLCVRAALLGLRRHIKHISKTLDIDMPLLPTDTEGVYKLPMLLDR